MKPFPLSVFALWLATSFGNWAGAAEVGERDAFAAYHDPTPTAPEPLQAEAARRFAKAENLFSAKRFGEALREFSNIEFGECLEFGLAADEFSHYLQTLLAVSDPEDPDLVLEKDKAGVEHVFRPYRRYESALARLRKMCERDGFGFNRGYLVPTVVKAMRVEEARLLKGGQTTEDIFAGLKEKAVARPVVAQSGGGSYASVDLVALVDFAARNTAYKRHVTDELVSLLLKDREPKTPCLNMWVIKLLNRWVGAGISIEDLMAGLLRYREGKGQGKRLGRIDFLLGELYRLKATRYYWMACVAKDDQETAWRYALDALLTPEGVDCIEGGELLKEKSIPDAARWRLQQYRGRE